MPIVLNVAEKPSAAREISRTLAHAHGSQETTRNTVSRWNKAIEFQMPVDGTPSNMIFTSVTGHLKSSDVEDRYRKWGSCDPALLLDPAQTAVTWFVSPDNRQLEDNLRTEARRAQTLILWLDCDSEGEKIAKDVADVCLSANRALRVRRARFSAMTRADLLRAVRSLTVIDERVVAMVATRQEVDLRAGAAYTRFLTNQVGRFSIADDLAAGHNPANQNESSTLVSYGPCQFPTLGLVVDRWLTIENFVQRPFWVISLRLVGCEVNFEWARSRIFEEYAANVLYELCVEECIAMASQPMGTQDSPPNQGMNASGSSGNSASSVCRARVERVDKKVRTRFRPMPLSTVELQKSASRALRISSDRTMEAAEKLYTTGLISYPRTETDRFDQSYNLRSLIELQTPNDAWGSFAGRLLTPVSDNDPLTFRWPRAGPNDDHAHPPIHPTAPQPASFASDDQRKVYTYIVRRFLASCSIDATGAETSVQVRVGSAECFGARGLIVTVQGYLEVMRPYERWANRAMPTELLQPGAMVPVKELMLKRNETRPPPLLSEADLISLMDRHGIGTDATIAEHIKKVQERHYVCKTTDSRFQPTALGVALVEALERCQIHLARPTMRSSQEASFKKIPTGELQASAVRGNALAEFASTFQRLRNSRNTIDASLSSRFGTVSAATWATVQSAFSKCGQCGGMMDLRATRINGARAGNVRQNAQQRAVMCQQCVVGGNVQTNGSGQPSSTGAPLNLTLMVPRNGTLTAVRGSFCPICNFGVLRVLNPSTNRAHTVCPKCFQDPPSNPGFNPEGKSGNFRCFSCTHPSCSLASGTRANQMGVAKCPKCASACSIATSTRDGATLHRVSCTAGRDQCDWVYFFPGCAEEVNAVDPPHERCDICSSKCLHVKWRRSAVPPGHATAFEGCVWCGQAFRNTLQELGADRDFPRLPHPGAPHLRDIEEMGGIGGRRSGAGLRGRARSAQWSSRGGARQQTGRGRGRIRR